MSKYDEMEASVARLQIKAGIEPDPDVVKRHLLATEIRPGVFRLGNKELTAEELEQAMQAEYDEEHQYDALYAEVGLGSPVHGLELHQQAMKLLASRGCHAPSFREYADALEEVAS
jgi:hypothetical protein